MSYLQRPSMISCFFSALRPMISQPLGQKVRCPIWVAICRLIHASSVTLGGLTIRLHSREPSAMIRGANTETGSALAVHVIRMRMSRDAISRTMLRLMLKRASRHASQYMSTSRRGIVYRAMHKNIPCSCAHAAGPSIEAAHHGRHERGFRPFLQGNTPCRR